MGQDEAAIPGERQHDDDVANEDGRRIENNQQPRTGQKKQDVLQPDGRAAEQEAYDESEGDEHVGQQKAMAGAGVSARRGLALGVEGDGRMVWLSHGSSCNGLGRRIESSG